MTRELTSYSGSELREKLKKGQLTHRALVDAYLSRIDADDQAIGAFLSVDHDGVCASADGLDRVQGAGGALGPLAGYVLAIKDNIAVRGMPMTAGSKILEGYHPPYEATVVTRLRNAGALIIGKTNLDEFAMGASTEQSGFHPTRNPHDRSRVPGGSSGGSAAAVAAGFCTAALGSDTGGSIRQPAAFCGLVGMRPTYGFVSRNGLVAMASSMDIIGPLARTTDDARAILSVMAGYDPADATTVPQVRFTAKENPADLKKLTVGIPKEYREGISDDTVRDRFDAAVHALETAGATVVDVSLPSTPYAVPTYYVITPAEASSNLARYDGIGYGPAVHHGLGHGRAYAALRDERFGSEPKRRILLGSFTLSAGFSDRYYHTAQRVRTLLRQDFSSVFDRVDVLMTPVTPTTAFPLGSIQEPVDMYRQDVFLAAASLAGIPAISIPLSAPSGALPVGIQLLGAQGNDATLLGVAGALEKVLAAA